MEVAIPIVIPCYTNPWPAPLGPLAVVVTGYETLVDGLILPSAKSAEQRLVAKRQDYAAYAKRPGRSRERWWPVPVK